MEVNNDQYEIKRRRNGETDVFIFLWTSDAPEVPGYYWLSEYGMVRVAMEKYPNGKEELVVYTAEQGRHNEEAESVEYYRKLGFSWMGPIPEPNPL